MAFNIGIASGPPPRKKSGLPPKVGGGKPHMAVMIAAIPKGGRPKPDDDEPPLFAGGRPSPHAAGRMSTPGRTPLAEPDEPPDMDELDEPSPGGGGGGEHPILPEAVNYRSEQETCANCVHMQDGECERLHIPVSEGDGCNLFADASGRDADESAEEFEPEEGEEEGEDERRYRA